MAVKHKTINPFIKNVLIYTVAVRIDLGLWIRITALNESIKLGLIMTATDISDIEIYGLNLK